MDKSFSHREKVPAGVCREERTEYWAGNFRGSPSSQFGTFSRTEKEQRKADPPYEKRLSTSA
jgi:hypothetical protein